MRVLVADDDVIVQHGLRTMLADHGHDVVGVAASLDETLDAVAELAPDVVVIDIRMPPTYRLEGLEAATAIRAQHGGVGVVVLSQFLEPDYAISLVSTCPSHVAYLLKADVGSAERITSAVEAVARGETIVDPQIVSRLHARSSAVGRLDVLSERELELLDLMARGHSNRGISEELIVSQRTVETHVAAIMRKLGLERDASMNSRVRACLIYLAGRGNDDLVSG